MGAILVLACSKGTPSTSRGSDAASNALASPGAIPSTPTAPSVPSPQTVHRTAAMSFSLERIPYVGPTDLYDGPEPKKSSEQVVAKPTAPWQNFTFADLEKHDLRSLAALLGEDAFRRIVSERKLRQAMPGAPWTSESRLPLFFARTPPRPGSGITVQELALVGFGEWQPTRYVVQVDSLWRITPFR